MKVAHVDGSFCQSRKRGGWAGVIRRPDGTEVVSGACDAGDSITMELTAVVETAKAAQGDVCIFTDCDYVADTFRRGKIPDRDRALWLELYTLASEHRIRVYWEKGGESEEHKLAHRTAKDEACRGR